MPELNNTSDILLARLAEGLDSTAKMTQALLSDLRESEADFAAMKTELNILKENVKSLSELIKDGGTTSLLTRVALIEQNIDNIKKWMDNHVDVHQQMRKEFSDIRIQISELERRLMSVESIIKSLHEEAREEERSRRESITREMDLVHEREKSNEKVRAEKQSAVVKIVAAAAIGAIGLLGGWIANSCTASPKTSGAEAPAVVIQPSPSPAPSQSR